MPRSLPASPSIARPKMTKRKPCARHTPCPKGYVDWHEWAEKKSKTHYCKRCPDCGLWAVWVPKRETPPAEAGGTIKT